MPEDKPKYNVVPPIRIPTTNVISVKESGSFSHGDREQAPPKETKSK